MLAQAWRHGAMSDDRRLRMPRTSPDAAARTPVSFDKVRGRHPPRTIAPEGDPTIIPGITRLHA